MGEEIASFYGSRFPEGDAYILAGSSFRHFTVVVDDLFNYGFFAAGIDGYGVAFFYPAGNQFAVVIIVAGVLYGQPEAGCLGNYRITVFEVLLQCLLRIPRHILRMKSYVIPF